MAVSPKGDTRPHAPNARALLAAQNERAFLAAYRGLEAQGVEPTIRAVAQATGLTYKVIHRITVGLIDAGELPDRRRNYTTGTRGLTGETAEERAEIAARKAELDAERAARSRHQTSPGDGARTPRIHKFRGPDQSLEFDSILRIYEPNGGDL